MSKDKNKQKKIKGVFEANSISTILGVFLAILLVIISVLTLKVNQTANDLVDIIQKFSEYQQTATMLQSGTSILSETATSFIQTPVIPGGAEAGNLNMNPISSYAAELEVERRPSEIVEAFQGYDVSDEVKTLISEAADYSAQMQEVQTHALALVTSVYPLPEGSPFNNIPKVELTEEEKAMPAEARLATAKSLMSQKDYSLSKSYVSQNIEKAHQLINEQIDEAYEEHQQRIYSMRIALWATIAAIALLLIITFVTFFIWLVAPLQQYESDMNSDRSLKRQGRVKELSSMVIAYNELLGRRNKLESILREAAETDALTGLPNRYSLERTTLEIDESEGSCAVVLFDVNFLKKVNDTLGHLKGDQLLKTAADCIKACFWSDADENCYRFGGDEFAAILRNCTEEDVKKLIEEFKAKTESENISVSVGYAFEKAMREGSFANMCKLADEKMYVHKKAVHDSCSEETK